jgi:predicted dithiol-disulfide oxidoreductase (DUF899 family)
MPIAEAVDHKVVSHKVVSHQDWVKARTELLAREKEFTHAREAMAQTLRELPWEKVEKNYIFEGENGKVTLADLFAARSQLVVYHFMFGPEWAEGCHGCSFTADHIDGPNQHLSHHDVTLMCVSQAPYSKLVVYKKRMGWRFPWVSSQGSDFNYDYGVSFTKEQIEAVRLSYNYRIMEEKRYMSEELPGLSVFYKDPSGQIFHTYSTYARGLDPIIGANHFLDLTPKGRNERDADGKMVEWVKRHDQYEDKPTASSCCHDGTTPGEARA